MKRSRALFALLLGAAVVIAAVAGVTLRSASASTKDISPIPAFSTSQLTAAPGNDWLTSKGDIWNRNFSSLDQINQSNVNKLKLAWHTRVVVPGAKANFNGVSDEAEPVEYGGTLYMPDSKGDVFAFDAATGERLWYYKPKYPKGFAPGLPTSRGIAIGNGKVYMAQTDASVVGLDQATGRVSWKTQVGDWKSGYFFTAPPTYVDGTLYIGTSGGDFGAASKVVAINASTGKVKWSFNLIPRGKELGAKTWAKGDYNGGGAVWEPLTVDPAAGLVYVGVGNPIPYNGIVRGYGDDLFTESVVALHTSNGKLKWYYQTVHHDIWDYDTAANPLVVFDAKIKGQTRHVIASMGKTGWVYELDRITGKPVLGIKEKKVPQLAQMHTAKTQPIPVGQPFAAQCAPQAWKKWKAPDGKPVQVGCIFTPYGTDHYTAFAPTALGGADWPPSSYSPKTGYMYICSKDASSAWKALPITKKTKLQPLGNFFQIDGLFSPPGTPGRKAVGTVVAMDMRTNTRAWRASFPAGDMCYSGVTSTQGGLVFVGRNNGTLQAYSDTTGKLLWTSPKYPQSIAAPAMTYSLNGKQYVAVYAGGNSISAGSGTVKVKYGSDLYVFALPS
ncbi:MAG TPA: PQQ-binding-like beta-propeller repeat protein [Gaiellaceae bacterium]|nr:PQQ-binding-like beta-propeller repeat protein [Gaiellaceae bacterium]